MFVFKHLIVENNSLFFENKRENVIYNIPVKYAKKIFRSVVC